MLVRSVENEVKRKNQLQKLTDSLAETNDKLRVINAKLERIDATKTDFIYIASHQLHKVPTPIKGYLSMLLEGSYGKLSKEQRRVLENIKLANDRQINLVDDLLNVSRMEYGKVKLDFKEQQLEDVCQEIYDTVRPVAEEKGLKFTYEKPKAALPKLILDKGKIFEAIFNFVDNAVKYTSKGRINLKIETDINSHCELSEGDDGSRGLLSGPVIRVTVADTGVGIAKESLPFLFAKFSRNDKANLNIEGTGLGLYVVKLMIEAHGGRTWAESDGEGEGSRFIIEIPTKQPENVVVKE
ncbi:MAG: HAMP domain-containing sensor histidine kinase [Parcubacteria group bacterium]